MRGWLWVRLVHRQIQYVPRTWKRRCAQMYQKTLWEKMMNAKRKFCEEQAGTFKEAVSYAIKA